MKVNVEALPIKLIVFWALAVVEPRARAMASVAIMVTKFRMLFLRGDFLEIHSSEARALTPN